MISTAKPQAILGVSSGVENVLTTVYPSIASIGLGRLLGSLYDSIPLKINGVKLSYLLFTLPTAPLAVLMYLLLKVGGPKYVLTNRNLQQWSALGSRMLGQVGLDDIAEVNVVRLPGQAFYRAADLEVLGADGKLLMRMEGIPRAEVFRENILEAQNSRRLVQASLTAIQARHRG